MTLDVKTLILLNFFINILTAFIAAVTWHQYRKRYKGLFYWFINMFLQVVGIGLILLRGRIHDFAGIVMANIIIVSGAIMLYKGLKIFIGERPRQIHNYILLVISIFPLTYYTLINPNLTAREIIFSSILIIFLTQVFHLLIFRVPPELKHITRLTGIVICGYITFSLSRIVLRLISPESTTDFFQMQFYTALIIALYIILHVCLIITLILMVTRRLLGEVQFQEEKYTSAFQASPSAILLIDSKTGLIVEVNKGFTDISGFDYNEAVGKTVDDLDLIIDTDEAMTIKNILIEKKRINNYEISLRKKSGDIITALLSADLLMIHSRRYILSSVNDITQRKKSQKKIEGLLHEKELILKEVHHRIKNNMNTVSSLLYMQADMHDNKECSRILNDAAQRITSMIVLYDRLYLSENFHSMSLNSFIVPLVNEITEVFKPAYDITPKLDIDDITLEAKTLSPLGIIINELITNTVKYASGSDNRRVLNLSAAAAGESITIVYSDSGPGSPASLSADHKSGFGMELISMLVKQIGGSLTVDRSSGMKYVITFKNNNS